ncbi:MAG: serine/threonine protein kinase [Polyangiaceae bacterium]|nr:serine/threonine protein kinase [Polyangiaceae bacterium]
MRRATAVDVLRNDEIRRTRALLVGELVTVGAVGLLAYISPGAPAIRPWLIGLALFSVITLAVGLRWRDVTTRRLLFTHLTIIPFVILAYTYFGVWSFFAAGSAVGVFVFAMGSSRLFAFLSYLLMASVPAVGMVGLALGWIEPTGLVRPLPMPPLVQLAFLVYIQLYLGSMYWLGSESRRSQELAVTELEAALIKVDERDALLDEAARDLERLEGRGRGRYTSARFGSWQLGALLGRGGMGEVYDAVHVESGAPAAVKLVASEVEENPEILARFQRESEVLRRLRHPAIVELYDVGEEQGIPYLAMERLDGESLSLILRKQRKLPPEQVVEMLTQIGGGLDHALAQQIVHRDLKPQNIFRLDGTGRWKVLDFGIAKLGMGRTITQGGLVGTPGYMAPEQIRGGDVDHRADVFALAAVTYRCLCGVPAFAGDASRLLYSIVHMQPRRPVLELHRDVELVLALGLAKAPAERFASAGGLAEALRHALVGRLEPALRQRAEALLAQHPWGGVDADDVLTERLPSGQ